MTTLDMTAATAWDTRRSLLLLRDDAIRRGDNALAIELGWSAIRLGEEQLAKLMTRPGEKGEVTIESIG